MVSEIETNPVNFDDWSGLHALLVDSFMFMEGRIDPPSSLTTMSPNSLRTKSAAEDLYLLRSPTLVACLFAAPQHDAYYLGKLAVAPAARGQGIARALIEAAASRARTLGLKNLSLQTRVELTENHAAFRALGFRQIGATAHPGFPRPTSLSFARDL